MAVEERDALLELMTVECDAVAVAPLGGRSQRFGLKSSQQRDRRVGPPHVIEPSDRLHDRLFDHRLGSR
jgi:hypothetical protein